MSDFDQSAVPDQRPHESTAAVDPAAMTLSTGLTPPPRAAGAWPGLVGLHANLPYATYHEDPALRHSVLHRMSISALHLKTSLEEGDSDSSALTLGRVFHTLVLQPELEKATVVVVDASTRGTNIYKAAALANPGKDLALRHEMENLKRMRDRFHGKAINRGLLAGAAFESTVFWEDRRTGIYCKARPDIYHQAGVLIDIKTTERMLWFLRDAENLGYFNQLAYYADGVAAVTGRAPQTVLLVAVEKTGARDSKIFDVTPKLAKARRENALYLDKYAQCLKTDRWPGYAEQIEEVAP